MEQIYTSKVDTWFGAVLIGAMGICVCVFIVSLRIGTIAAILSTLPVLIFGIVLPFWLMISTYYVLSYSELVVKSGPFKWVIPISEIKSITPTSNPLSSPALSLDRIRIHYGSKRALMISPELKSQFMRDLESRRRQTRQ